MLIREATPIERLFAGHRPEHPNGRLLVTSGSASDWRAEKNILRDLRRLQA